MTDEPEAQLRARGAALADAISAALPRWVRSQTERVLAGQGIALSDSIQAGIRAAGDLARAETGGAIRALLEADVDEQRTTPLALLRQAVAYPSAVLSAAGAAPVARDRFDAEAFPGDVYNLVPARFADLDPDDPDLAESGLAWGAAKAFVHRRRHRAKD